jgi:hypothetical protein
MAAGHLDLPPAVAEHFARPSAPAGPLHVNHFQAGLMAQLPATASGPQAELQVLTNSREIRGEISRSKEAIAEIKHIAGGEVRGIAGLPPYLRLRRFQVAENGRQLQGQCRIEIILAIRGAVAAAQAEHLRIAFPRPQSFRPPFQPSGRRQAVGVEEGKYGIGGFPRRKSPCGPEII